LFFFFKESEMTIERYIRIIAGLFIMISVALGAEASPLFVSPWFLAFTAFVGLNLFQFGFTKFCPLCTLLAKLGVPGGPDSCGKNTACATGK
jgi:hypothetical protein